MALDLDNLNLDDLYKDLTSDLKKEQRIASSGGGAPAGGKKRILAVDDDKNILKMLKTALSDNYDVSSMVNGMMAMQYLQSKSADLILLDYEMPEESGPEVLKKLRDDPKTAKIPVIFLTGVSDSDKFMEALMLQPNGYLLKPINIDRLRIEIRKLIG